MPCQVYRSDEYACKAMCVLGVRVPLDALYETERRRGCAHAEEGGDYCRCCGEPMWVDERRKRTTMSRGKEYLGPLMVTEFADAAVLGYAPVREFIPLATLSIKTMRAFVENNARKFDCWNAGQFGVWVAGMSLCPEDRRWQWPKAMSLDAVENSQ